MKTKEKNPQKKFQNLVNGIYENIENIDDEEMETIFDLVVDNPKEARKQIEIESKERAIKTKQRLSELLQEYNPESKRESLLAKIQSIFQTSPEMSNSEFGMAFRNKEKLSVSDLESMIEDLKELGLLTDTEENDDQV